ncbi:choloylglycine hydrolase family protein [Clostridium intestinale]|uniref:Penicillin amidase n=1 Tax=Clostridium intestinale URNW TaxID=1294142 RepID=U2NJY6_9CLOT|nr:choloylglycine hydrolase family protein [Clostridium intestinale]ERK29463.1 penicillin amidase [Clostridium intestinale URNW]
MCTAITLQSKQNENYLGRNMDFSYIIDPEIYIIPKNYTWNNILNTSKFRDYYSFIAIGQEVDGLLDFFDGVNEKGFAAAALYFPGYANYDLPMRYTKKENDIVASMSFLHYILGRTKSVDELYEILRDVSIVGFEDPITEIAAPLHWIATDRSGKCVVIEKTEIGLTIFENPIGVLANSPDFSWHMTNLRNYTTLSPRQTSETYWGNIILRPFGHSARTSMLPGGYTSPERFVKTAYQKTHLEIPENPLEVISTCFHILDSVALPKGTVITDKNTYDFTKYIAFMNTKTCEYYFKTYENNQIIKASLFDNNKKSKSPFSLGKLIRPSKFKSI